MGSGDSPPDLREAYAFAKNVVRMQPDAFRGGRRGHRICWVRGTPSPSSFGLLYLDHTVEEAFTIFGSHPQCNIVLPGDSNVALRHLLVRSIATGATASGMALRILDLHTDTGFGLPDGSTQTSVIAEGPVAVAIGSYAIVALPSDEQHNKDNALPNELPPPQINALFPSNVSPYRINARRQQHHEQQLNTHSRITLMPRLVMVGEPIPPRMGRLATGGAWGITLERAGRSATLSIAEDDLMGGVMIGRSEKCVAEALRRITDENTSRVHVLLLRENNGIFAYDLASTHGTFYGDYPIRRAELADNGTLLTLGRGPQCVRMYWHRLKQ